MNQERSLALFRDDSKSTGSRNRDVCTICDHVITLLARYTAAFPCMHANLAVISSKTEEIKFVRFRIIMELC